MATLPVDILHQRPFSSTTREAAIYFYGSVVAVNETTVFLYYDCTGVAEPNTTFLCIAISSDGGATFVKPHLDLISYAGTTGNNLIFALPYDGWPNTGERLLGR